MGQLLSGRWVLSDLLGTRGDWARHCVRAGTARRTRPCPCLPPSAGLTAAVCSLRRALREQPVLQQSRSTCPRLTQHSQGRGTVLEAHLLQAPGTGTGSRGARKESRLCFPDRCSPKGPMGWWALWQSAWNCQGCGPFIPKPWKGDPGQASPCRKEERHRQATVRPQAMTLDYRETAESGIFNALSHQR